MNEQERKAAFKKMLGFFVDPTEQEFDEFYEKLEVNFFKKGEIIESLDTRISKLHFVLEGIARHYYLDEVENEITIWLTETGGLATDYAAFTTGRKTKYKIVATTEVSCLSITSMHLNQMYDKHKVWERLGRLVNQQYLNAFIDRNNFLVSLSAKERYESLFKNSPHFFNLIPLKHLATYLHITPETLSRLRASNY